MFRPFTDTEYVDMAKLHIGLKASGMKETYNWNLNVDENIHGLIARESQPYLWRTPHPADDQRHPLARRDELPD